MLRLYDFRCTDNHVFEKLVDSSLRHSRCSCGKEATRIISPIKCQLNGADDGFPGAHMKWVREHERAGAKAKS